PGPETNGNGALSDQLTEKELTVLRLAAEGASAEETAKWMRRGLETVKSQRSRIIAKLRARNMINAVALSYERGVLWRECGTAREPPRTPQRSACGLLVDPGPEHAAGRDLRQPLVGVALLVERLVEEVLRLRQVELVGQRARRAVCSDLVVLDTLRGG